MSELDPRPIVEEADDPALGLTGLVVERGRFSLVLDDTRIGNGLTVGLLGPNGAGKTTLLETIAGRLAPTKGCLDLFGVPAPEYAYLRSILVGLVRREPSGFPWMSVGEHLMFRARSIPGWDRSYVTRLSEDLRVPLDARLSELSDGNLAKVNFLAIEGARPPLLLLDEPADGLDPVVRRELYDLIRSLGREKGGRTVVIATHRIEDVAPWIDRILLLSEGRLIADRTIPRGASEADRREAAATSLALMESAMDVERGSRVETP